MAQTRPGWFKLAPTEGATVLDSNDSPIGPDGAWVPKSTHYLRRVRRGDAVILEDGDDPPPPEPDE